MGWSCILDLMTSSVNPTEAASDGDPSSVAVTVTEKVPGTLTVPWILPVVGSMEGPDGRLAADQVMVYVPNDDDGKRQALS